MYEANFTTGYVCEYYTISIVCCIVRFQLHCHASMEANVEVLIRDQLHCTIEIAYIHMHHVLCVGCSDVYSQWAIAITAR